VSFEHDLRRALERREPPAGFAERVAAKLPERRSWLSLLWPLRRGAFSTSWMPATAGLLIAAVGAGTWEHGRAVERRREAEEAKAQLVYALELTSAQLQSARLKLLRHKEGNL
jgi:hypothetical protein